MLSMSTRSATVLTASRGPGMVAESVEHCPRVREILGSNPGRVKPLTYQIDTRHFLARYFALLG